LHLLLENQEERLSPHTAQRRYEEYKQEYDKRNTRQFFKQHQEEEWLKEKYFPPILEERFKEDAIAAQKAAAQFFEDLRVAVSFPNWDAEDLPPKEISKEPKPDCNGHKTEPSTRDQSPLLQWEEGEERPGTEEIKNKPAIEMETFIK